MSVGEEGKALRSQLFAGQLSPQLAGRGLHAVQRTYSTVSSCSVYSVVGEQCRAFQLAASREAACCRLESAWERADTQKSIGRKHKKPCQQ